MCRHSRLRRLRPGNVHLAVAADESPVGAHQYHAVEAACSPAIDAKLGIAQRESDSKPARGVE